MAPDYPDYTLPIVVIGTVVITGEVIITAPVEVYGAVTVSGAVTVTGTVSITGSVTVTGTVSISGSVTVTGAVTVSGPVTISTIAADNIVIDRLTVTAYKARSDTLSNDHNPTPPEEPDFNSGLMVWGKFFPRGCRGHIHRLGIYCYRDGVGTITLSYAPQPGMGAVGSVTITPGLTWDWAWGDVDIFWNYDSLFIWISACSSVVYWGVNDVTPYDTYIYSAGTGLWSPSDEWRMLIRAEYTGLTAGDLPVSGTLNTVELMTEATGGYSGAVTVPTGVVTSILTITGSGRVTRVKLRVSHSSIFIRFYVDGTLITAESILAGVVLSADQLNALGYAGTTPQIQLLVYALNGLCYFAMQIPFEFRRSFEIRAGHSTGVNEGVIAGVQVNLKR